MSAYGAISKPYASTSPLPSTIWTCKARSNDPGATSKQLSIHHLTLVAARSLPGIVEHLREIFALDIEAGRTYPQESIEGDGVFEAYFFAADVFVAIAEGEHASQEREGETDTSIEKSRKGRSWPECVVGFYYVGNSSRST